ncbi:uncharacterized protein BN452_02034 [Clostridium sp. CAG:1013]|nr:uncharacterized protein BN452_02034 [Clostridium sp. CAG:1013]
MSPATKGGFSILSQELHHFPGNGPHRPLDDIGRAHKPRHVRGAGGIVHLGGSAQLLKPAVFHHGDPVGHVQGFLLVMGDVNKGDTQLLLQPLQFLLHLPPQLQVQGSQGLVQQQQFGPVDERPGDGHTLFLAAGKFSGHPLLKTGQLDQFQHLFHFFFDLALGPLPDLQGVAHVLLHGHVGEQSVVLEHGVHVPPVGLHVGHVLALQQHPALVRGLQPGDDPQGGGFAAARGPQQGDKFPLGRFQAHTPQHRSVPKALIYLLQFQDGLAQNGPPLPSWILVSRKLYLIGIVSCLIILTLPALVKAKDAG